MYGTAASPLAVAFVGVNEQWPEEVIPGIDTLSEAAAVVVREATRVLFIHVIWQFPLEGAAEDKIRPAVGLVEGS